jgi:hypothetical protein
MVILRATSILGGQGDDVYHYSPIYKSDMGPLSM